MKQRRSRPATVFFETKPITVTKITEKQNDAEESYLVIKDESGGVFFCFLKSVFNGLKTGDRCIFKGFVNRSIGAMYLVIQTITYVTDIETPDETPLETEEKTQ